MAFAFAFAVAFCYFAVKISAVLENLIGSAIEAMFRWKHELVVSGTQPKFSLRPVLRCAGDTDGLFYHLRYSNTGLGREPRRD